jgi:hypothetical protein
MCFQVCWHEDLSNLIHRLLLFLRILLPPIQVCFV